LEQVGEVLDPILWSAGHLVTNPAAIESVHEEYLAAGVDIISTSSYQISYEGCYLRYQMNEEAVNELLRKSVRVAKNIIDKFDASSHLYSSKKHYIAGSLGCYGAHLANGSEYTGSYRDFDVAFLAEWHAKKLAVLSACPTDCIAFETIPIVREVQAITEAIDQHPGNITTWISLACQSATQLNGGEEIEEACRKLEDYDLYTKPYNNNNIEGKDMNKDWDGRNRNRIAFGVNCTAPQYVEEILHTYREFVAKHRILIAYPNRGDHWHEEGECYLPHTGVSPDEFASLAVKWRDAGARIIGGCCQTTPETIAALTSQLNTLC
jgi:homocysteine S-methyltransferase